MCLAYIVSFRFCKLLADTFFNYLRLSSRYITWANINFKLVVSLGRIEASFWTGWFLSLHSFSLWNSFECSNFVVLYIWLPFFLNSFFVFRTIDIKWGTWVFLTKLYQVRGVEGYFRPEGWQDVDGLKRNRM